MRYSVLYNKGGKPKELIVEGVNMLESMTKVSKLLSDTEFTSIYKIEIKSIKNG